MSFFGFDASLPGSNPKKQNGNKDDNGKTLDFEETYKGLGDYAVEEYDYLNDETFGGPAELGTDFDFGHGSAAALNKKTEVEAPSTYTMPSRSYVAAASSGADPVTRTSLDDTQDLKPMESLWTNQPRVSTQQPQGHYQTQGQVLSMEDLERQQRQRQMAASQQGFMGMAGPGYGMPPPHPQGFMQHQFPNQYPSSFSPQGMQNIPPFQQMQPVIMNQGNQATMYQPPLNNPTDKQQEQGNVSGTQPMEFPPGTQLGRSPQMQPVQPSPKPTNPGSPMIATSTMTPPPQEVHNHQQNKQTFVETMTQQQHQHFLHPQQLVSPPQTPRENFRYNRGQGRREPLTAEEQKRLQIRQAKVEKILKHSGLMTPRDKDFITRYQLSQIVTDDPYNEDFYFQVYKIIQSGGIVGEANKDLIARAYLEHSGHRLGGRYKRADVALQRMQSQVEKAVTVAKERPQKSKDHIDAAREGVLGKISSAMNSKAPRRQLQIPLQRLADESAIADDSSTAKLSRGSTPALEAVTETLGNVEIDQKSKARRRSSYAFTSVDQSSVLSRSGGRKFVLSLIETVYEEVLELEAQLRSGNPVDSAALWEALHIGDESYEVCPFISMLSFDKGVKIMPRIFNFLDNSQKLKLLQTFFGELSHLNIIIISSYKTNASPSENQLKQIELFQAVFLKIIVSFLSNSANFIEIMGLLLYLIRNNNVSFISTSKIGLNLITVLISRAALIRQDINRSNVLSSPEISAWNEVYDKLFTSLETRLSLVFPPKEYTDKTVSINSRPSASSGSAIATPTMPTISTSSQYYDQAYIWQFLASLALSGKLNHQRIIIDEIRDEIFGTITAAEELGKNQQDQTASLYKREKLYQDLNLFLNVMGLVARDGEITELK
ncbi:hypothetical protein HG535_0A07550 [Zygotorulaspora mrakii]|uniref:mRNA decay factor PAT1 domain-containing protein n=1 Tax=Zygotorulaspora mrakii TaxID=42260 RepID=A0A7H9AX43_ZYGMR|nr:uncharacterized protein HG535_0A07550 [Zygotorulaspora mrakii]QLG70813.1 hypothetical protein HG535_0A07550 [Zygotorulaspora mrakii]